jgi:hypothetical protein
MDGPRETFSEILYMIVIDLSILFGKGLITDLGANPAKIDILAGSRENYSAEGSGGNSINSCKL